MFQFGSLSEFIQMDGHGPYVWAAYLISLLALLWLVVSPLYRKRKLMQEIVRQQRREVARRQNANTTKSTSQE
ncbi:MAG: heme exporter protein CcmD [Porticoccus sp.]